MHALLCNTVACLCVLLMSTSLDYAGCIVSVVAIRLLTVQVMLQRQLTQRSTPPLISTTACSADLLGVMFAARKE